MTQSQNEGAMDRLQTIDELSKESRLSVKSLRNYDELVSSSKDG
jgi:hypothetical protein